MMTGATNRHRPLETGRAEFAFDASVRMRDRFLQHEIWERVGVDPKKAIPFTQQAPARADFLKILFTKIVASRPQLGFPA